MEKDNNDCGLNLTARIYGNVYKIELDDREMKQM